MEFRVEELCDYASGRQNQEDKLEERKPRCKRESRKIKQPKREGRAAEDNGQSGGTNEKLILLQHHSSTSFGGTQFNM